MTYAARTGDNYIRIATSQMATAQDTELSAVAFQLAAKLESYESVLDVMAQQRPQPACFSLLSREIERIGRFMSVMPQIAGDIVDLTLRHIELMRLLSKPVELTGASARMTATATLRKQSAALQILRDKCIRLIARS